MVQGVMNDVARPSVVIVRESEGFAEVAADDSLGDRIR
jgi:hypothetical protein